MPKVSYHVPVLKNEAIEGLNINPNGIYIDATYGGGGHSGAILEKLKKGKLVAFDQDNDAEKNVPDNKNLLFLKQNFRYLKTNLRFHGISKVNGILADLGVSSHQFDNKNRGFSFRHESILDMRMNQNAKITAADILNHYSLEKMIEIFREYGEVYNAQKLASIIVKQRDHKKFDTTGSLVNVISPIIPKKNENQYLAQVFQALRIEVNKELVALKDFLMQSIDILDNAGRLVIISYHSLEDRLVKNFMKTGGFTTEAEKDFFGNTSTPFKIVNKKVITPSTEEIKNNNRARSAKMRIAEKI